MAPALNKINRPNRQSRVADKGKVSFLQEAGRIKLVGQGTSEVVFWSIQRVAVHENVKLSMTNLTA